jgi:hypothetical protein
MLDIKLKKKKKKKKLNYVTLVPKRTILNERPPLVGEDIVSFCG